MTLPDYTTIYKRVFEALATDLEDRGVPFEETHKAAQGITSALWHLYSTIEKEKLPEVGNAVVDSVLELFQ
jgi:hypothetical protein